VNGLLDISNRIRNIQIENRPAIDLISKLDSKETVFYLDPPYLPSVRKSSNDYLFEMNQAGHVILADKLKSIKGKVILSGYESELYKSLYSDFYKIKFDAKMVPMSRGKGRVTSEMIWLNYDPLLECKKQYSLF
jgi:DNA adenine methylase